MDTFVLGRKYKNGCLPRRMRLVGGGKRVTEGCRDRIREKALPPHELGFRTT